MALPIGALFGIARLSDHAWIAQAGGRDRGVLPRDPGADPDVLRDRSTCSSPTSAATTGRCTRWCTGLVIYNSAVLAEVVRAGILSLPKGQTEAALAVGMRKGQLMTSILLPQAVTAMLPAIVSQLVVIVKDTALGGVLLDFAELMSTVAAAAAFYGATSSRR